MTDFQKEAMKKEFFEAIWNEKATAEELKARCKTSEEKILVDEAKAQVEMTDRNFVKGFTEGIRW